ALATLARYPWPGNIRELENVIERAVILSCGTTLQVPLSDGPRAVAANGGGLATLGAAGREHIRQALRESQGVIGGRQGAAARLGLKRTTLIARMRKLGITRQNY